MKTIITAIILSLFLSTAASAEDISSERAERIALRFAREVATAESVWQAETYFDVNGEPIAYAITVAKNSRIVSSELELRRLVQTGVIDHREGSYLTVVVSASLDLPPVIAYYDGLPAHLIAHALVLRADGNATLERVVYVSPFESYMQVVSKGGEATYSILDLRERDSGRIPEPEMLSPEQIDKNNRMWEKSDIHGGALPASISPAASKVIGGVPDWNQPGDMPGSCGPTSSACILAYWDGKGYPKLQQSSSYNLISELASEMGYRKNEGVYPSEIPGGIKTITNTRRGYSFSTSMISGVSLAQFKQEIDAGRPFCYGSYDNPWGGGHAVCGVGYDGDYIVVHDNWPTTPADYKVAWSAIGHWDDIMIKVIPGGGGGGQDDDDGDTGHGKVVRPNEGMNWKAGKKYKIKWSGFDCAKVKLELFRNSKRAATLSARTNNDGKQRCKLPAGLKDSDRYRIKVISLSDSSDFAWSDYFSIGDGGGDNDGGNASVIKPGSGSLWWSGESYEIKWKGLSGSNVSIDLYSGWFYYGTIKGSTANDGSHTWSIPSDIYPGFYYYIVIKSTKGSEAISDYFTIW